MLAGEAEFLFLCRGYPLFAERVGLVLAGEEAAAIYYGPRLVETVTSGAMVTMQAERASFR